MKKLIALALITAAGVCSAASFEVDKTCKIGTKDFRFEYTVDSNVPDSPAKVTFDGATYHGFAEGGDVAAKIGAIIAIFEFREGAVKYNMVTEKGLWLINSGTCAS